MYAQSNLNDGLRPLKKAIWVHEEVATREFNAGKNYEAVFEGCDDEKDKQLSSTIEDVDSQEDWEDVDESLSSIDERGMFRRVDSKTDLTSRRSLLTRMLHEKDRATVMQNAAPQPTPSIRQIHTCSPNGPLNSHAEAPNSIKRDPGASPARPIVMTTSNVDSPALSPPITRDNMLSIELTESLRKHLLWYRQVDRVTTNAVLERRHTAQDMTDLQHFPVENATETHMPASDAHAIKNSWNYNYLEYGLQEYHQRGWQPKVDLITAKPFPLTEQYPSSRGRHEAPLEDLFHQLNWDEYDIDIDINVMQDRRPQ